MSEDLNKDVQTDLEPEAGSQAQPEAAETEEFDLADYMAQYKQLEEAKARLEAEKEEQEARHLRLQADFDNYRRRSRSDSEEAARRAAAALAESLLPVLDNFERALGAMEDTAERQGVELIMKQLLAVLNTAGLAEIPAQDAKFDPNLHHAVSQAEAGEESKDLVTLVLQKGYTFNGRLLRAAMVQVGV